MEMQLSHLALNLMKRAPNSKLYYPGSRLYSQWHNSTLPKTEAHQRLIKGFHASTSFRLHWGFQDVFLHLNNVQFLRFFESGRLEFFHSLLKQLPAADSLSSISATRRGTRIVPQLLNVECRFRQPVTFPDTLTIASLATLREQADQPVGHLQVDQIMVSHEQAAIVARSSSTVAIAECPIRRPGSVITDFKTLELSSGLKHLIEEITWKNSYDQKII